MDMQSETGTTLKGENFDQVFSAMTVYEFKLDKLYKLEVGGKSPNQKFLIKYYRLYPGVRALRP